MWASPRSNGFTIVEALVALVVLSLIAVALVPLITQGYTEIFIAGHRIRGLHEAQRNVDLLAITGNTGGEWLEIGFSSGDIQVDGIETNEVVTVQQGRTTSVTAFIPKK